jgi:thiamine biosynthesis protein ThiS
MNKRKKFFLNGEEFFSDKILNLSDVITYFNYNSALLVLEYNSFICPKENWSNICINNKDKIEVVTIVGGG